MLFAAITNIRQVKTADPFPGNPVWLAPLRVPEEVGARLRWTAGIIVHCVVRDADVHNAGTDRPDPAAGRLGHRQIGVPLEPGEETRRCSAWRADPLPRTQASSCTRLPRRRHANPGSSSHRRRTHPCCLLPRTSPVRTTASFAWRRSTSSDRCRSASSQERLLPAAGIAVHSQELASYLPRTQPRRARTRPQRPPRPASTSSSCLPSSRLPR